MLNIIDFTEDKNRIRFKPYLENQNHCHQLNKIFKFILSLNIKRAVILTYKKVDDQFGSTYLSSMKVIINQTNNLYY